MGTPAVDRRRTVGAPIAELTHDEWDRIIGTNLTGVFNCCKAIIPHLRARGGGWIVNLSSLAATNPFPGGAAYCASKAGLNAFSDALMQELRDDNIRVTTILPGSVATGFNNREPGSGSDGPSEARRRVPYLGVGSAGPALVADRLLPHLPDPDPRLTRALERSRSALTTEFHPRAGLFTGRAGVVVALRQLHRGTADDTEAMRRHLAAFDWHAVRTGQRTEFLGEHLLRRSNDLGTGSAGVLLALDAALGAGGTTLPFLESPR